MANIEQGNPYLELKQRTDRDVRQLGPIVTQYYEAESTASQTQINLSFAVEQTDIAKKQVLLIVDGNVLREGSGNDYQYINASNGQSSQVQLAAPLAAGLNIIAYRIGASIQTFPTPATVQATLNTDVAQPNLMAKAGFQNFIEPKYITAPNTQIVNRAQVLDTSSSLGAIAGIERIHCRSINLLQSEFGANGEKVFQIDSKDTRVRFVGNPSNFATAEGTGVSIGTADTTSYIEVTAYCTGINILMAARLVDLRISVDGGAETTIIGYTEAGMLQSRNYTPNQVVAGSSGLSLGWHTFRFRRNSSGNAWLTSGFEFLNERTDLAILPGTAYCGTEREILSALSTSAFNTGVVGARGARIVKYISGGAISQAVQEVNASTAYFASADHTNEEIVRKINFREFGANRADDFSTIAGVSTDRAFTLDDGTTTLVVNDSSVTTFSGASEGIVGNSATISRIQITFVGTGLDFMMQGDGSAYAGTFDLHVDGTRVISAANWSTHFGSTRLTRQQKVVSGLPYGTHTVQMQIKSAGTSPCVSDFFIYQPKKPSIPDGAVEIADYNLLANFVFKQSANDADGGVDQTSTSQGVLRKVPSREGIYVGASWNIGAVDGNGVPTGIRTSNNNAGHYLEYTFWGTGFDMRNVRTTAATTITLALNGTTITAANFPTATFTSSSGFTTPFNSSTGVLTLTGPSTIAAHGFAVTGLPYGKYTLRATQNTANAWNFECLDIITPIHINKSNFKVGSLSLIQNTGYTPVKTSTIPGLDLSKAKAWVQYSVTGQIVKSFNISAILNIGTGQYSVYFEKPFKDEKYIIIATGLTGSRIALTEQNLNKTNYAHIRTHNMSGTLVSDTPFSVAFFDELDGE